jgi:exopolysaccharide/PEP-CTERM locus tyrosine autokinase
MKSTIEKALQLQKEAEAARKAALAEEGESTAGQAESDNTSAPNDLSSAAAGKVSKGVASSGETLEIDLERLENLGFVTLSDSRRLINEEYREIKRKLLSNAFGPLSSTLANSNIIMVSSPRPGEGKTFTAVNLALSIAAEQDKTVLLVDADVLKPNVLRTLGLKGEKGLMDYLLGEVNDLSDVIYKTNVPKLRIIPAGSSHHRSTELLASSIMNETVNEFSKRYADRVVIIDTPPMIGINESAILASFAGQAIIVVEEGRSKMQDIEKAAESLNPEMAIGFVVNKSIMTSAADGYYGYGHYGEDRDKD